MGDERAESPPVTRRTLVSAAWSVPLIAASVTESRRTPRASNVVYDADFSSLEEALAAVPTGGTLEVGSFHKRQTAFIVDKSVVIRFVGRGSIHVRSASEAAIAITASDIRLEDVVLRGAGGHVLDVGDGIRAIGTADAPLTRIQILRPQISEFSKHGILFEHVHEFRVSDVDVRRCGYAGIMLISAVGGSVSRGLIKDILQPDGWVNSYGVAVTRRTAGSIEDMDVRSRDVRIEGLTVDGVRKWEALDTHAGENITFRENAVYNSFVGIAIVGSKGDRGDEIVYAPLNCHVIDNTLKAAADGTAGRGIIFAGAAGALGKPVELATGRIAGNIVQGFGAAGDASGASAGAGIQIYGTAGISVLDNLVIEPASVGIDLHHDNYGAKAVGNTIIDVWSDSSRLCSAITLRSLYNKVAISGTSIVRMNREAVMVNDRGLTISGSPTNVVLDGGGNDWSQAVTRATVDAGLATESRNYATKAGFYGVPPVPQAGAIPSPAADPTDLKVAIDAIRMALVKLGLTE